MNTTRQKHVLFSPHRKNIYQGCLPDYLSIWLLSPYLCSMHVSSYCPCIRLSAFPSFRLIHLSDYFSTLLYRSFWLSVWLSVFLTAYLSTYLSVCLSIYLSYLSLYLPILTYLNHPSICQLTYLFIHLPDYRSILAICLSVRLSLLCPTTQIAPNIELPPCLAMLTKTWFLLTFWLSHVPWAWAECTCSTYIQARFNDHPPSSACSCQCRQCYPCVPGDDLLCGSWQCHHIDVQYWMLSKNDDSYNAHPRILSSI